MNWDALGAVAELLAAVGVIVSLLYLATQIRQNTQSVRANTYQEFTRESAEISRLMLSNPEMIDEFLPVLSGERPFDPQRDVRFHLTCGLYARNLQAAFVELERGRIDQRLFDSYASYHIDYWVSRPGWEHWWELNRKHFDPEYVAWIDARLAG